MENNKEHNIKKENKKHMGRPTRKLGMTFLYIPGKLSDICYIYSIFSVPLGQLPIYDLNQLTGKAKTAPSGTSSRQQIFHLARSAEYGKSQTVAFRQDNCKSRARFIIVLFSFYIGISVSSSTDFYEYKTQRKMLVRQVTKTCTIDIFLLCFFLI